MIRVKYYYKEHPNTTLSVFLKTEEQVEALKPNILTMFMLEKLNESRQHCP
jgi:hypothetical protein